jgi:integrase
MKRRAAAEVPLPHLVPLSRPAVALVCRRLQELLPGEDHLFPETRPRARGERRKGEASWWSSRFVRELRLAMAEEFTGQAVDREDAEAVKAALEAVPRWTIHNLRHTAATLMREHLGVSKGVVRLLLAHVSGRGDATAIYDRSELLGKRRAALVAWAAWLEQLEQSEAAQSRPKVRPIAGPAAGGR